MFELCQSGSEDCGRRCDMCDSEWVRLFCEPFTTFGPLSKGSVFDAGFFGCLFITDGHDKHSDSVTVVGRFNHSLVLWVVLVSLAYRVASLLAFTNLFIFVLYLD